jgi:acetylornithine deacetylase/succinyl-diaminopimelate desuccinylase-like protein
MDLMRKAGAEVRIDAAGNIFASRPGRDSAAPGLLFGSHIDSVPNGGNFDGDLGSLCHPLRFSESWEMQTSKRADP